MEMSESDSYSSDDDFSSSPVSETPSITSGKSSSNIVSPNAPLHDLLLAAKASMASLKSELGDFDVSNLDEASPPPSPTENEGSIGNKAARLVSPDPPLVPLRRDGWIAASRGCGEESKVGNGGRSFRTVWGAWGWGGESAVIGGFALLGLELGLG